ncbi:DNA repair protein XRCC2 homolog isoform X2 [Ziziphus jujuba]|uniref:DNA repair protein XRCC2 homolog isoform X2 n=1 Tax=Ziziphus jujuba TaxID=326968 RepID=A0ABM3IWY9_ZIZJJ|nr:DNA repair protein XRCC2 homolog isoform X2 [Ziziphus jujuba]
MPTSAKWWIDGDESAAEMLARVSAERSVSLLPPPLHRLPLRVGNVVELVGPSPSAKTLILIQAAINTILPSEWNGVHYGGLERSVMFIDLDCRFDILCLSEMLKHRIMNLNGSMNKMNQDQEDIGMQNFDTRRKSNIAYDEELYTLCMRRFLYVRCYDSFEFLSTLKTMHCHLQKEKEVKHSSIHLLMIDRKSLSLQSVFETVVQEIRKLVQVHPMLVIATKTTTFGDRNFANEAHRKYLPDTLDFRNAATNTRQLPYQENMPSVWQSFVTHRVHVRPSDHVTIVDRQNHSLYLSEWLLPSLSYLDKFIVQDGGVFLHN